MNTLTSAPRAAARRSLSPNALANLIADGLAFSKGKELVWLLTASLIVRLGIAAFMPFTTDEAYAVVVSRSHALSYYDHPPLMFAIVRAMADMTHTENPFLLRLPFVLMGTGSAFFVYNITCRCFDIRAAFWAVAAFSMSPIFLLFGQVLIVPDGPLDFFLLFTFWAILPIVLNNKRDLLSWSIAGIALSFAIMSKYQAILFGLGAIITLVSYRDGRELLKQPGCWLAFGIACLGILPIIIWNAQHNWISLAFQTKRAYQHMSLTSHIINFATVIFGQAIYVLPGVWLSGQKAIWQALTRPSSLTISLMAVVAVIPILTFDVIGLYGRHSLPHWAMSGFLFALPFVGDMRARVEVSSPKSLRHRLLFVGMAVPIIAATLCLQTQTALFTRFLYSQAPSFDVGWQNLDWSSFAAALPNDDSFIVTPDWVQAGHAGLVLGESHPIEILTDPHQFQYINQDRLRQLSRGYFVAAYPTNHDGTARARLLNSLKVRFDIVGQPSIRTQYRMGFPSFHLMIVPIKRLKPV